MTYGTDVNTQLSLHLIFLGKVTVIPVDPFQASSNEFGDYFGLGSSFKLGGYFVLEDYYEFEDHHEVEDCHENNEVPLSD
jgi:hypothetical protein